MNLDIVDVSKFKAHSGSAPRYRNRNKLLPSWCFNMIICGKTGSGKSFLVLNLIYKMLAYDKLYFYSRHLNQPTIKTMIEFFEKVKEKTGDDILYTADNLDDIVPMEELDPNCQNLIIWDDFIMDKQFHKVSDFLVSSRHKSASNIVLSQHYIRIPRTARLNCHYFAFYNVGNKRELSLLYGEVGQGCKDRDDFMRRFKKATKDKYSFFFVDTKTKIPQLQYRKNFNQVEFQVE